MTLCRSTLAFSMLIGWALHAGLPAQAGNVYVVDSNGGPGVDFTELPVAVQQAAPGDTLDVRPGTGLYRGFTTSKGLHILGRPGVQVFGACSVVGLPANQSFTLRGVVTISLQQATNSIVDCAGSVVWESVGAGGNHFVVSRSHAVHFNFVSGPFRIVDSTVSMDRCFAAGLGLPTSPSPAIVVGGSKLTIANSTVTGSTGVFAPPGIAIVSTNSELTVTGAPGTATIEAGQTGSSGGPIPAISGTGSLVLDPGVLVRGANGGSPIAPGIVVTNRTVPSLTTLGTAIGGTLQVDLSGPAGEAYFIAVGLMSPQTATVPGVLGEFWLRFPSLAAFGVLNASGATSFSAPVPNAVEIVGLQFASQAVTAFGLEDLRFSNPAISTFRL